MLDLVDAQQQILQSVNAVVQTETIDLTSAYHRVLARPVYADIAVPPNPNSAMDGYAICCDQPLPAGTALRVIGVSLAGKPYPGAVRPGQAVRIMTGACMPKGANTVVIQEEVQVDRDTIVTGAAAKPGQHVRNAGEDLEKGACVYQPGRLLTALDLGVLASVGCCEVTVYRRLNVGLLSTGDELKDPGQTLAPGEIYNSNRVILKTLLAAQGAQVVDLGVVPDDPQRLKEVLLQAAAKVDVLISTGGVSVGDADCVRDVMQSIGEVRFCKVAIKPGKPFAFGYIKQCDFYGLPGNPVSSVVTYQLLVALALQKKSGQTPRLPRKLNAIAASDFNKRPGRAEFQRGLLSEDARGQLQVGAVDGQGSHQLYALANADCLVCLSKESTGVKAGEFVEVWPL